MRIHAVLTRIFHKKFDNTRGSGLGRDWAAAMHERPIAAKAAPAQGVWRVYEISRLSALAGLSLLAGCASVPSGPSVMALPGSSKPFQVFQADDANCRQYAQYQVGGTADQAAADAGVRSAIVGTVIGAAAGAALGGHHGAGVGAGTGLLIGSMAGAGAAQRSAYGTQRQFDNAYVQCMYAKGHQVPVSGSIARQRAVAPAAPAAVYNPPPPHEYAPPPPPPGNPPPPPPR